MMSKKYYSVGNHVFRLEISSDTVDTSNYAPFACEACVDGDELFGLHVGDFAPQEELETIGDFNDDIANIKVCRISTGYSFRLAVPGKSECCLLQTDDKYSVGYARLTGNLSERSFGLNNAIMMMYAFASACHDTLMLHASVVEKDGKGYLFLGKSGTGKSTHSRLWLEHIPGSALLNDDNPVMRFENGILSVYGTPWSGKTPCYINRSVSVGAVVRLRQMPRNEIVRNSPVKAFAAVMPSCSSARWDSEVEDGINDTLTRIAETQPVYTLGCLPDKAAAEFCFKTVTDAQR